MFAVAVWLFTFGMTRFCRMRSECSQGQGGSSSPLLDVKSGGESATVWHRPRSGRSTSARSNHSSPICCNVVPKSFAAYSRNFSSSTFRFGNELGQAFVQPKRDGVGIKAMHDEMHDFVAEKIVTEFVTRIALDEQTSHRMNPAAPRFQLAERLKLLPFLGSLENIDMRLDVSRRLLAFQFLCDHAIMKLRLYRHGRGDITVHKMVNEMLGLAVFPL